MSERAMNETPHPSDHHKHEQRTDVASLREISPEAMRTTFDTLTTLMDEYWSDSPMWATFCEAKRWVEYEMRVRFGDEVWATLTAEDTSG